MLTCGRNLFICGNSFLRKPFVCYLCHNQGSVLFNPLRKDFYHKKSHTAEVKLFQLFLCFSYIFFPFSAFICHIPHKLLTERSWSSISHISTSLHSADQTSCCLSLTHGISLIQLKANTSCDISLCLFNDRASTWSTFPWHLNSISISQQQQVTRLGEHGTWGKPQQT